MFVLVFFVKRSTAYEISACVVGSEVCIGDSMYGDVDLMSKEALGEGPRVQGEVGRTRRAGPGSGGVGGR